MRIEVELRRAGVLLLAVCATLVASASASAPAWAEPGDPLFTFYASPEKEGPGKPYPAPGGFEGPCGIAVDSSAAFYVSDYYRDAVDAFKPASLEFVAVLPAVDPLDGPCGLALDAGGRLFVNDFHRGVLRYTPSIFPPTTNTTWGAPITIDAGDSSGAHDPTGVAVDVTGGNTFVDDRTYVAVYAPGGEPVLDGGSPLRIGEGPIEDGYGVAVSEFAATKGFVYVPDAGDDTVKVFDPIADPDFPVAVIDGHELPEGGFVSLRDSAVAVDRVTGTVYVADNLQPGFYERPEAAIYAFGPTGAYLGRLKYNVVDARPPGLAVDNSAKGTQGRVYVTSGNSEGASVVAYAPGELTKAVFPVQGSAIAAGAGPGAGAGAGSRSSVGGAAAPPVAPLETAAVPRRPGRRTAERRHRRHPHRHHVRHRSRYGKGARR